MAQPVAAVAIADVPQQPVLTAAPTTPLVSDAPSEAADIDVIEKEWIIKIKHVISGTKQDPYKQVVEINKLRVDYMKKRYDKDIKLADD